MDGEPEWVERARDALLENGTIAAIKLVRSHTGLDLKESKHLVETGGLDDPERIARLSGGGLTGEGSVVDGEPEWVQRARTELLNNGKVAAIKLVRSHTGLDLKESKNLVETGGLDDPERIARLSGGRLTGEGSVVGGEPAWVERARDALLNDSKIAAIKLVRSHTGLDLKESKHLVETGGLDDPERIARLPVVVPRKNTGCFPASALVCTPDGPRRIDEIRPGDAVWSLSVAGGLVVETVTRSKVHPPARLWRVECSKAAPLLVTANHRMRSERGWLRVDQLVQGDRLIHASCASAYVQEVGLSACVEPVFNLYTTGTHAFLIGGFVAHNFSFLPALRTLLHRVFIDWFYQPSWFVVGVHDRQLSHRKARLRQT